MQLLEGPKERVLQVTERIKLDPRHKGMILLLQQENVDRQFDAWAMGFKKLSVDSLPDIPGYSDFLNVPLNSEQFVETPSKSLKLLMNFKNIMR